MLDRLDRVFRSLSAREVRYVVIGGIAAAIHGVPRATFDLDMLIAPTAENARRLLSAFRDAGLVTSELTTPEGLLAHEITVFKDFVRIDVQTRTPGLEFESAWRDRMDVPFAGTVIRVVSRKDLIRSKKKSGRPVDLEDVRILESLPERPPDQDNPHPAP